MNDPSWRDGLRSLHPDEWDSFRAMMDSVFRPGMLELYPHVFNKDNARNLLVVVANGEVVSHIGTIRRDASILGCRVRAASLGGVGTYEAHRGKGYATALFDETMRRCRAEGVDFMHVSGYRKIYHRYGCRYVGADLSCRVTREEAAGFRDDGVEPVTATADDTADLAALYRREPVRWMRLPADYDHAIGGYVMNRPCRVFKLLEQGHLRGYAIMQEVDERSEGHIGVQEFAGDRKTLMGALAKLAEEMAAGSVRLHVSGADRLLQDLMTEHGIHGTPANISGTVTLVNFEQFMERMRPYFGERLGEHAASGLVFREVGDECHFIYGGDRVVAEDRGRAIQIIFGTLDGSEEETLENGGRAGQALREIFPLPGLWYGPDYV